MSTFTVRPSRLPGTCATCRHLNYGTTSLEDGILICRVGGGGRSTEAACEAVVEVPDHGALYLYEPYDGENGTWDFDSEEFMLAVGHLEPKPTGQT